MWWRLIGGMAAIGIAALGIWLYGNARFNAGELTERVRWKDATIRHERDVRLVERKWSDRVSLAQSQHATRVETIKPFIVTNTETVTRYAQTPAGRVLCLPPERVLGIEQTRAALFAKTPTATEGSARALLADPASERLAGADGQR